MATNKDAVAKIVRASHTSSLLAQDGQLLRKSSDPNKKDWRKDRFLILVLMVFVDFCR